jgi:hypothetical protein
MHLTTSFRRYASGLQTIRAGAGPCGRAAEGAAGRSRKLVPGQTPGIKGHG